MHRELAPASLAPAAANYALAVVSDVGPSSRVLHTSGIVPARFDGTVPDDLAGQAVVVWDSIRTLVSDAGMAMTDIVSVTTYVVVGEDLSIVMAARDAGLGTQRAASTLLTVPALARPEWRMEIAIVAIA